MVVREGAAHDEWRTANVKTKRQSFVSVEEMLGSGELQRRFCKMILYHLVEERINTGCVNLSGVAGFFYVFPGYCG